MGEPSQPESPIVAPTRRARAPFVRFVPKLTPQAVGAMLAAGVVGALAWALIVRMTDYEIGFVAWGIGLLVGLAGQRFSGGSGVAAVVGAAVAVLSIVGGKWLGVKWAIEKMSVEMPGELAAEFVDAVDTWEAVKGGMSAVDLLFFGLGVYTAFQTIMTRRKADAPPAPDA